MRKNKVKPVSVWPSVRVMARILNFCSRTYSLLSVSSLKSGMKGGLPAVEKKVPYMSRKECAYNFVTISYRDWERESKAKLDIEVGFIASKRRILIIQTTLKRTSTDKRGIWLQVHRPFTDTNVKEEFTASGRRRA